MLVLVCSLPAAAAEPCWRCPRPLQVLEGFNCTIFAYGQVRLGRHQLGPLYVGPSASALAPASLPGSLS